MQASLGKLHSDWQPGETEGGHQFAYILQLIEIWIGFRNGTLVMNQGELVQVHFVIYMFFFSKMS
jgi:hypothetical protein